MQANKIICGDAMEGLKEMPEKSIQCCVTSPPYWGLRDYGTEPSIWGGNPECNHDFQNGIVVLGNNRNFIDREGRKSNNPAIGGKQGSCSKCNAWLGNLGQEPTPEMYTEHIAQIFRELRRVLRDDGTLWLNLGDNYYGSWQNYGGGNRGAGKQRPIVKGSQAQNPVWEGTEGHRPASTQPHSTLKNKDMVGIPWRVAFALQADGWYLRSDIIWHKPNPMPESVTDRPTKSHEYLFLLTKSKGYYYDAEAIKEDSTCALPTDTNYRAKGKSDSRKDRPGCKPGFDDGDGFYKPSSRNKRSVWTISTKPYPEAHFAVFPEDLIIPCIKAGTSEEGCCSGCGSPWERILSSEHYGKGQKGSYSGQGRPRGTAGGKGGAFDTGRAGNKITKTIGWKPTCVCWRKENNMFDDVVKDEYGIWSQACTSCIKQLGLSANDECENDYICGVTGCNNVASHYISISDTEFPVDPCSVLDPFMGSGTTALVATKLGRKYLGIERNPEYVELAEKRLKDKMGLFL